MPLSVNEIVAHLSRSFPVKAYNYEVRIYGNGNIQPDAQPELMLNCSSVNVPGTNIGFSQIRKYGIGSAHNVPVGRSFTELNMTFYETDGEPERKYFADWQDKIFNKETLRFRFYKDIVKTISIIQYDKKKNKVYECKALECFPSNISPLDRGYANEGVAQFNVNFQFYTIEEIYKATV